MLRAERIRPRLSEERRAVVAAAVKVFAFGAVERIGSAARRAAFFVAEDDDLTLLLGGIRRFTMSPPGSPRLQTSGGRVVPGVSEPGGKVPGVAAL